MDQRKRLIELLLKSDPLHERDLDDDLVEGEVEAIADHLIANGVIVPPCKVGDTVYRYSEDFGTVLTEQIARDAHCGLPSPTMYAKSLYWKGCRRVVHCKDCKHNVNNKKHDPLDIMDYTDIVCDYFMTDGMEADDFCSKGEVTDERAD